MYTPGLPRGQFSAPLALSHGGGSHEQFITINVHDEHSESENSTRGACRELLNEPAALTSAQGWEDRGCLLRSGAVRRRHDRRGCSSDASRSDAPPCAPSRTTTPGLRAPPRVAVGRRRGATHHPPRVRIDRHRSSRASGRALRRNDLVTDHRHPHHHHHP